MYKKVCCTCKAVVLLILTYCFFDIISHGHCRSDIFNSPLEVFKRMFRIVAVLSPVNRFRLITDRHGNHIYGFTVCCNPENVLQRDEPTSPLYWSPCAYADCTTFSFHMTQWAHNENPSRRKGSHFCGEICPQCLCFHGCYLPPLPTTQPHPPPPTRTSWNNSFK